MKMKSFTCVITFICIGLICMVRCNIIPDNNVENTGNSVVALHQIQPSQHGTSEFQSLENTDVGASLSQQGEGDTEHSLHISEDASPVTQVNQEGNNVNLDSAVTINNFPEVEFNPNPSNAESLMAGVKTMEDFMQILEVNGRPVTNDDIFSEYDSQSGKMVVAGGGRLAVPDDCSARNSTVRILPPTDDANVVYFPKCTTIERCGGCCQSPYLECVPDYNERVAMKVFKAKWQRAGNPHLEFVGFAPVILDRHVRCRVKCTLTAERCGPRREFLENVCDCRCKRYERCSAPLVWDTEECMCKCQAVTNCCDAGEPDCGLVFDESSCSCQVDGRLDISGGRVNYTEEELAAMAAAAAAAGGGGSVFGEVGSASNQQPEEEPETTVPTTTTTTTPRTTTAPDPCATVNCPGHFTRFVNSFGQCVCRPRMRMYPGRRGRLSRP